MVDRDRNQNGPRMTPGEAANELHNTVDTLLDTVLIMRQKLREVQAGLTAEQFMRWAGRALDLDAATARDFLAFDGTMGGITDRMIRYFERNATR